MVKNYDEDRIIVPRFNEESGFYTTKKRSKMMSKIRGKNTKPEMRFRRALWAKGIKYRVDSRKLPGRPDVSIRKYKLAIFVDGEYWHGYNWEERRKKVKTNREFWIPKIERNIQRDREVNAQLQALGFKVFRFWESEVKKELETCINQVSDYIEDFKKEM